MYFLYSFIRTCSLKRKKPEQNKRKIKMCAREREREKIKHNTTNGDKESEGEVEKSKVRAFQNRCGRKIKAKTTNGQNERKEEIRGAREKSQSSYGLWRRRSVLICFQVVLPERISHFVSACLQSKLFVNASRGCLMTHLYDALLLLQLCSAIQLQPAGSLCLQSGDDDA